MPRSIRRRLAGALAPAGIVAAALAVALPASPSAAATGSQLYQADMNLSCILAPGVLNSVGTVALHVQGDAPSTVDQGDTFNLTNVTTSLTTPANWSSAFFALGAVSASGSISNFVLDSNGSPAQLNAAAALGPNGLPFGPVPVANNTPLAITIPSTGPFTISSFTVTAAPGGNAVLTVDPAAGFTGTQPPYKATGSGIIASATGYDSSNNVAAGPFPVVCTAPTPAVVLGSIPITGVNATTTTTTSSTTTTTTTTTTSNPVVTLAFKNWKLTGSVTDKKLNQKISLPSGATFNGSATLTNGAGPVSGDIKVPPFSATITVLGLPTKVGVTLTETGPATGTITQDTKTPGNLALAITSKDNLGINGLSILGISIPTSCTTSTPVVFQLNQSIPALSISSGVTFTGTTTFPSMKCSGGLGGLIGPLLTSLFSGPSNPFTLTIAP